MSDAASWYSESLARGLSVIRAFGHDAPRLRISEVAERTGLTRAAARRFLLTLKQLGYLDSDGDHFYLRPRILDLGYSYISSARLEEFVEPILKDLADRTQASAHLAVLDEDTTLFIACVVSRKMLGFFIAVGARRPAYAGSLGKVLLAGLSSPDFGAFLERVTPVRHTPTTFADAKTLRREIEAVAKQGYGINNGEHTPGVVGIAVPVRDRAGRIVAAVNINWYSPTPITQADTEQHLPALRAAAQDIEGRVAAGGLRPGFDMPARK